MAKSGIAVQGVDKNPYSVKQIKARNLSKLKCFNSFEVLNQVIIIL